MDDYMIIWIQDSEDKSVLKCISYLLLCNNITANIVA